MNLQLFIHKWKKFEVEFKDYLDNSQDGLVGRVHFTLSKHFSHRVFDRSCPLEYSIVRRMFYHVVNNNLGEVLFWWYSNDKRDLVIRRKDFCIVLDRGEVSCTIVARTFYKRDYKSDPERFFIIDINI